MQYFDGQVRQLVQNRNNPGINIWMKPDTAHRRAVADRRNDCRLGGIKRGVNLACTPLESGETHGWENHVKRVGTACPQRSTMTSIPGFAL